MKIKVGDIMDFANINWRVLDVKNTEKGKQALLISVDILELRAFNDNSTWATWEFCTLRQYLNNEFYNSLGEAKAAIALTKNDNPANSAAAISTESTDATLDYIFLLSIEEAYKYFSHNRDLPNLQDYWFCEGVHHLSDEFDQTRMAYYHDEWKGWWLRSPGSLRYRNYRDDCGYAAAAVGWLGSIDLSGDYYSDVESGATYYAPGGVRPALWLNL
jgi:hypothetical protein